MAPQGTDSGDRRCGLSTNSQHLDDDASFETCLKIKPEHCNTKFVALSQWVSEKFVWTEGTGHADHRPLSKQRSLSRWCSEAGVNPKCELVWSCCCLGLSCMVETLSEWFVIHRPGDGPPKIFGIHGDDSWISGRWGEVAWHNSWVSNSFQTLFMIEGGCSQRFRLECRDIACNNSATCLGILAACLTATLTSQSWLSWILFESQWLKLSQWLSLTSVIELSWVSRWLRLLGARYWRWKTKAGHKTTLQSSWTYSLQTG